ncbi:MAG: hypothetical protein AAB536_02340 [Patescibacteria group bacterium]
METVIRVRDVEITFRYIEKRLKIAGRANFSGGRSTSLSDAEYASALLLAAEKLGIKIKLKQAA